MNCARRIDQTDCCPQTKIAVLVSAERRWLSIDGVFATRVFRDCRGRGKLLESCLARLPHAACGKYRHPLYDYAKRILSLRDQAFNVVAELKSLQLGRVRIGANESTSLYLLPHLILEYRALYPNVLVEIFRQSSERLPREVLDRNVDFAVMAFEPVDGDLESFPVSQDELVLITHPEHYLARRESVAVEELGNQPFLAHNVKTGSRYKVMETFAQHHTPLNITLELATVETIKRFVQLKIGLAFVPRMCVADELERGSLVSVPVDDLSYVRTLWVTHRRGMTFSHAAAAFLAILHDHARTHISEK